jgi:hypothetical protein
MAIDQLPDGRWKVDVEPIKGKRFRKTFKTKGEAQRFEATCRAKVIDTPDWSPRARDRRRLLELLQRWGILHGNTLADYEGRELLLRRMIERLGDPMGQALTTVGFAEYRAKRLAQGISPKTMNNELSYLRAMFNVLIQYGEIEYPNHWPPSSHSSCKTRNWPIWIMTSSKRCLPYCARCSIVTSN